MSLNVPIGQYRQGAVQDPLCPLSTATERRDGGKDTVKRLRDGEEGARRETLERRGLAGTASPKAEYGGTRGPVCLGSTGG